MNAPADLSTLSQRMRWAADILDEVNAQESRIGMGGGSWTPGQLRNRAADWDTEDTKRRVLVQQLYMDMFNNSLANSSGSREIAECLIKLGWRKGDVR